MGIVDEAAGRNILTGFDYGLYGCGYELHAVPVPGLYQKLGVPVFGIGDLRVHLFRVDQDFCRLASQSVQCFEDHDGITKVVAVGRILAVCKLPPVDALVGQRRAMLRAEEWTSTMAKIEDNGNEDEGDSNERSVPPPAETQRVCEVWWCGAWASMLG